jgi:acyl-coenzyme A thioesterase PaaI-like protein
MATALPATRSCFVCGSDNPLGMRLRFTAESGCVRAVFAPRRDHVGFQETVHGGLTSTVLDEAMTWACGAATSRFAYCAELTVRFLKPVRPGATYELIGWLKENRRNRLFVAEAELRDASGTVVAAGSGKYLPIDAGEIAPMLGDFHSDPFVAFAEVARERAG